MKKKDRAKRSGSWMTRRQLARTVAEGRLLTFTFNDGGEPLVGYLAGMDDFHWLVLTQDAGQVLVHKGSASRISIASTFTYAVEGKHDVMERIIGPFRDSLIEEGIVPPHLVRPPASKGTDSP